MARVHSIRHTVSAIIHGDLKHRLPTDRSRDELSTLASTINGMLDQIEQLVHGVRNVSNSIAHDLRTPLAELRSRLEELALIRPPPEVTFAEIDGAVADVDRVMRIFDALLRLAEIDAGLRRSGFVAFDLVDLAGTAVEFYAPAAELKNIRLQLHAEASPQTSPQTSLRVSGDPILLAQALSNLIDNALKYTPENGAIDVTLRRRADGRAEIAVTDNGPGIDDSEKAKVVERFYRGDASRGTPGVGLGLSLAQAVAKLHGSALELADRGPGLSVVLAMALSEAPASALGETRSPPLPETSAYAGVSKSIG
jgi:signal transduction histidine kinase